MSDTRHIADAECEFKAVSVTPDFCVVNGQVVPFDIYRDLRPERTGYCQSVFARGARVLTAESVVAGVVGNMGKGILSTVSQSSGDVLLLQGSNTVRAEKHSVCRDQDLCLMNVKTL